MCLKKEFEVKVCKSEVVAPALPMQEYWLPLSNLDLLLPPIDFGVFFCYTYNELEQPFAQIVAVLKKALAQTLVSYYAFAGVLVKNSAGEPELLCNNSGVEFVEAVSDDVGLEELNLYNPDESISGKLVPLRKQGVLAVQGTQRWVPDHVLRCGTREGALREAVRTANRGTGRNCEHLRISSRTRPAAAGIQRSLDSYAQRLRRRSER